MVRAGVRVVRRVVVAVTVDGVEDAISSFVETVTEGVVVTVFVVISHITLVLLGGVDSRSSRLYSNLGLGWVAGVDGVNLPAVAGGLVVGWLGGEVGVILLSSVPSGDGTSTFAVLTLGDVNLGRGVVGGRAVDSVEVSVVGLVLDFYLATDVTLIGFLVTVVRRVFDFLRDAFALLLGLLEVTVLADVDFLAVLCWTADAVFFVDADLLFIARVATVGRDGGREGFVMLFVTFPSDDRSL